MRNLKGLVIVGIGIMATDASISPILSTPTVYLTLPTSPVTKTAIAPGNPQPGLSTAPKYTNGSVSNQHSVSATAVSHSFASSLAQTSPAPTVSSGLQDSYSFVKDNGTTIWLGGKTPPASVKYVVQTSKVNLRPLPLSVTSAVIPTGAASEKAVPSTLNTTKVAIRTVHPSGLTPSASKNGFTGHGTAGWNSTTLSTVKIGSIKSIKPTVGPFDKHINRTGTTYPTAYTTGVSKIRPRPREIGDIVSAEINGVWVSWTNDYHGPTPEGSAPEATESPHLSTLSIYPSTTGASANNRIELSSNSHSTILADPTRASVSDFLSSTSARSNGPSLSAAATAIEDTTTGSDACPDFPNTFTVDFDDLPHFDISSDIYDTDISPIFNPYNKLYWQNQFGYVPPPSDPFLPHSPPQLAVYRAHAVGAEGSPDAGLELPGEFGAGPRLSESAYWIDAHSVWLGCADGNHTACSVVIYGYKGDSPAHLVSQYVDLPACPGLKGCHLTLVNFSVDFINLSGIQIVANVAGRFVDYYMDDILLSWSNYTCAAQLQRSSAH